MATTDLGDPSDYDVTPVDHDPFYSVEPVDHDPFAPQNGGDQTRNAPVYDASTIAKSPYAGQSAGPAGSPNRFSDMVGQAAERGADYLGADMSVIRKAGDIGKTFAGMTGLDAPDDISDALHYAGYGDYGAAAGSAAGPFLSALGPMAKVGGEAARALNPSGFYSHGMEMAAALPQEKGTVGQFTAALQKAGVKPAEIEATGLADMPQDMKVRRDAIAEMFGDAMPDLRETLLKSGQPVDISEIEDLQDQANYLAQHIHRDHEPEVALDAIARGFHARPGDPVNPDDPPMVQKYLDISGRINQLNDWVFPRAEYQEYSLPAGENYRELLLHQARAPSAPQFQSSHWEVPNVIAHLRMQDLPSPEGGKMLNLDELQSDWGQQGRQMGFNTGQPASEEEISRLLDDHLAASNALTDQINLGHSDGHPDYEAARARNNEAIRAWREARDGGQGVPAGPFVGTTQGWTDLGLKRALVEAARGGYDSLSWTPGAVQSARYGGGASLGDYYDKVIPNRLSGIVKKLDPSARIDTAPVQWSGENQYWIDHAREVPGLPFHLLDANGDLVSQHPTREAAEAEMAKRTAEHGLFPRLRITPLMRERILKGLPQYASGGAVGDGDDSADSGGGPFSAALGDPQSPSEAGAPPLSDQDRDALIRTLAGEAGGEPPAGQAAVAHTIFNRAAAGGYGDSVSDVVHAPAAGAKPGSGYHEFSTWNPPGKGGNAGATGLSRNDPTYASLGDIVDRAHSGLLPDQTGGATHYYAPRGMPGGRPPSQWPQGWLQAAPKVKIGNQIFIGGSSGPGQSVPAQITGGYSDEGASAT